MTNFMNHHDVPFMVLLVARFALIYLGNSGGSLSARIQLRLKLQS
jgi:hypothetical protein